MRSNTTFATFCGETPIDVIASELLRKVLVVFFKLVKIISLYIWHISVNVETMEVIFK